MINEWMTWITTACAPQARKLGYLYEAIAMQERVKRCLPSWRPHLAAAQGFAIDCIRQQPPGGIALVLGSGLGVDLPKDTLLEYFDEVWLVDMLHLRTTKKFWNHPKVRFIEHDVTESLAQLIQGDLSRITPSRWLAHPDIRFVLSANILGQLPVQPLAWLNTHHTQLDDAQINAWSEGLLQGHLDYLQAFAKQGTKVCLIADLEWHYAEDNKVRIVVDAWRGVSQSRPKARWEWRIAPRGELSANRTQTNWVGGWCW